MPPIRCSYASTTTNRQDSLLFVYGTLRRCAGHRMHEVLAAASESLGPATTQGRLYDVGPFPAMVPSTLVNDVVHGEHYRLKKPWNRLLGVLDDYEGYVPRKPQSSVFVRRLVVVAYQASPDGTTGRVDAWAYFYNRPHGTMLRIASGDYCQPRE